MLTKCKLLIISVLILITFKTSTVESKTTVSLESEMTVNLKVDSGVLEGTLLTAKDSEIVALIIAGSGPTDRNGNNPSMVNNSLKMLAKELFDMGVSSLRYDKRGVGASTNAGLSESKLRFEHYIKDAKDWITFLNKQGNFKKIVVIGHSEGSLIGMVAAQLPNVDMYISIAGAGQPIDKVIREQLKSQPPVVLEQSTLILNKLLAGKTADSVPAYLHSLFRPSVQLYMISWFKYAPQNEIAKLNKPVLILHGTTDIQVSVEQAKLLSKANTRANMVLIEGMNHILKEAPIDRASNIQTYTDPNKPLKIEIISEISKFLRDKTWF